MTIFGARLHAPIEIRNAASGAVMQARQEVGEYETQAGPDSALMEAFVVLSNTVTSLVRETPHPVEVQFERPKNDQARQAIAMIVEQRWTEGRAVLEQIVADPAFESMGTEERAALLFDAALAIAWEPGPVLEEIARIERAQPMIVRASELDQNLEVQRAQQDVADHLEVLRRDAMLHSERERLAGEATLAYPTVPPGYMTIPPAPAAPATPAQ